MKIITDSRRYLVAGLLALSLSVALAPQSRSAVTSEPSAIVERSGYPLSGGGGKDGQETHGGLPDASPVNGGREGQETHG